MNTRSIHVRLIVWYSALTTAMALVFGAYMYQSVRERLYGEMEHTLIRRAHQIDTNILPDLKEKDLRTVAMQIKDVYSPEANGRFIRILKNDRSVFYVSGMPKDQSFDPKNITIPVGNIPPRRIERLPSGIDMLVVAVPAKMAGESYTVEMGAPTNDLKVELDELIATLLFGLPVIVLVISAGGYVLVRRAMMPVEAVRATAEQITFGNLSNRLPVTPTGDALEHLSITLNQMLGRLEDAYLQASRFSADASHELRTPLTIMRGELEALVRDEATQPILRERIGSVLEETERLSRITESLFAISRLEAGEAKIEHTKFDLAALAKNTAEQMALLAEEKSITLSIRADDPVFMVGDAARMKQVVVNLLDNAIKYTPEKGAVKLLVRATPNKAVLEISDNGVGIPAAALPHVFKRLYRADKVRSRELGGAGLGLSIVRLIIEAHGGTVNIDSTEGQGTLCRVELPLANGQERSS